MYKTLLVIALIVSVATLTPLTSQAFLGTVWSPFSGGSSSGCGYGGYYGGYGSAGYGGYGGYGGYYGGYGSAGYGGYELGRSHGYTGHHKYKGAVRSEDKTRADRDLRPIHQRRGTPVTQKAVPTGEKSRERPLMKKERKHKPEASSMMERGRSEQEKPEKKGASGRVEAPAGTGHADEKSK
jgi:hypothetical protein